MSFDFFRARILNFSPNVSEIFENLFFVRNQIKLFSGTKKSTPNLETHQNEHEWSTKSDSTFQNATSKAVFKLYVFFMQNSKQTFQIVKR